MKPPNPSSLIWQHKAKIVANKKRKITSPECWATVYASFRVNSVLTPLTENALSLESQIHAELSVIKCHIPKMFYSSIFFFINKTNQILRYKDLREAKQMLLPVPATRRDASGESWPKNEVKKLVLPTLSPVGKWRSVRWKAEMNCVWMGLQLKIFCPSSWPKW